MTDRAPVPRRDDLVELTGYHSPQVEAAVRLNTNESPVPPPPAWYEEIARRVTRVPFHRYPDRTATDLRRAIGALHGVGPERVFCANGSNEVLQSLLLAYGGPGRRVGLFEPTYTLHTHIAMITGTGVVTGQRDEDFLVPDDEADRVVAEDPVITFLCSPNNPTGRAEPEATVRHLAASVPGLLVVDEAYGQFASSSALDLVADGVPGAERIVVVRTFSKTWAMAGARLGYLVGPPDVVASCEAVVLPYHLDAFTQMAGLVALEFRAEMEQRVALLREERGRIAAGLADLDVDTWPSDANFVLFRPRHVPAVDVWRRLLDRSVLVRDCSAWPGISGCLRVTVGTPDENLAFLSALRESL